MRQALQDSPQRQRQGTSRATHASAPVGGWNTRDSLVGMDSRDALVLDNWFPQATEVWQRGGSVDYATGMTGTVQSLVQYNPPTGTKKMIAFTNAGAYDVSVAGPVSGLMTGSAFTIGYVNALSFTNSAGTAFLWVCNGFDTPMTYNGVTWIATAITGVTPTSILQAWIFKHRIWFIEKGTMNVYYLPIDSIQGAATIYPMGNLFRLGGSLVAGTSWTLDGGDGPDDALVLVSSEGEVAVFQGTDPNSASSWGLSGVYQLSRPCGQKCFFKLGGDVGIITESGVYPLSRALQLGSINFAAALSNKIQPSFQNGVNVGVITAAGWEGTVYPKYNALIINIPAAVGTNNIQYVMNTITGQWCSFSGWSANAFTVFNGQLYFGVAGGKVEKAWDGSLANDNGVDIVTSVQQAYQYFGNESRMKQIKMMRFLMAYDGNIDVKWTVSADYDPAVAASLYPRGALSAGAVWDTADWNTSVWGFDVARFKQWKSAAHVPGYALSLLMTTAGKNSTTLRWAGTDYILDGGGMI